MKSVVKTWGSTKLDAHYVFTDQGEEFERDELALRSLVKHDGRLLVWGGCLHTAIRSVKAVPARTAARKQLSSSSSSNKKDPKKRKK
jgi:hypothetical protein